MQRLRIIIPLLSLGLVAVGVADDLKTWDRYRVIVDRAPFGPIYKEGAPGFEENTTNTPEPPVDEGPKLSDIIKLSAITVYGGMPAAGFTESTENKSFYLYQGKSAGDYTLVEVRAATKSIVLRKGDKEEEIFVGGTPSAAAPAAAPSKAMPRPSSPARPAAPGQSTSYRELHQQRNEERQREIQARIEEATQRREEERARRQAEKQAEEERRAKNVENIINGGEGDPTIELNRAELEKLGEAGFDVAEPLRVLAENEADRKAEEDRKREEALPPRLKHREGESTEDYIRRIREEREEAKRRRREGRAGGSPDAPPKP